MLTGERLEFVKQRVDDDRLEDKHSEDYGQRGKPEIEPPALRTYADDQEENEAQQGEKREIDHFGFTAVEKPRAPALDRLFIVKRERMPGDADRKIGKVKQKAEN